MKTVLTNSKTTITIDTTASKSDQYRQVVAGGCDLGRTSFMNLLSGKATEAKGWKLEEVKPEPKAKVFGLDFKKEDVSPTRTRVSAPRTRRNLEQVFANARKGKFGDVIKALESKGFTLVDVEKNGRWFCLNTPSVKEAHRNAMRLDISPLKNGGVNFSLYNNDRAMGVKVKLAAADVNLDKIVEVATSKQFTGARA